MDVHLPAELERLVQDKVASGRYRSADDVISTALRAFEEQDLALDARAQAFKAEIERRLASGPATPMDFSEVKRRIRAEVEAGKRAAASWKPCSRGSMSEWRRAGLGRQFCPGRSNPAQPGQASGSSMSAAGK